MRTVRRMTAGFSVAALTLALAGCGSTNRSTSGATTAVTIAPTTTTAVPAQTTPPTTVSAETTTVVPTTAAATRTLKVTSIGRADGVPDRVTLLLAVQSSETTAGEAMRRASADHDALVAWLSEQGITDKNMQTAQLYLNPVYAQYSGSPPPITGYSASIGVNVRIDDITRAAALVDGAIGVVGTLMIQGLAWSVDDTSPVLTSAREHAFAGAQAQAEQLAGLSGMHVGAIRSVSEGNVDNNTNYASQGAGGMGDGGGYVPGVQTFQVAVTIEFELVP